MAGDSGISVLLTNEKSRNLFPFAGRAAICMDSDWPAIAEESTSNLAPVSTPANLAYVIYTSGTTGRPKGAMIEQRGLVNYLCWAIQAYGIAAGISVPVHTSISFDLTVTSLYPALLTGGRVELSPEEAGTQFLAQTLRRDKNPGLIKITPPHLDLLSRQLHPEEMAGTAKTFVIGGENLMAERLSSWRNLAPATRFFNEYGPTETVVGCCVYELQTADPRNGPVPIGRPIANMRLYALDPQLQPVAPGVTGELYIGGAGVGCGYINRPALTREKFLVDPFSGRGGARLYKTGDLARYRNDGTLEFVGRVDDQVKVRGYRIELGEVEATLARHSGVRSCAVSAREDATGNNQLVGYVIARESETLDADGLRSFLRDWLPEFMVPAYFVLLDRLPLTQNGKIDRKNLPPPSDENILSGQEFMPPCTETEKKLAAIWRELLKVKQIGICDDFFDLGGDSLLAVRAMSQIEEVFGIAPSMKSWFPRATIAGLAKALEGRESSMERLAYAVPAKSKGDKPIFFCVGAGFLFRPLSMLLGPDQPFVSVGIEPEAAKRFKAPYRMEELARHMVSALREREPRGPYYLGGFCNDGAFAYEMASQLTAQGQNVGLLVLFESENPSPNTGARIATGLRRMIIRLRFRLNQLLRLKISGVPSFVRGRWEGVKDLSARMLWRISQHFQPAGRKSDPSDLERILFLTATSYRPKPVTCSTVLFRCTEWPITSAGDPHCGWRELLTGPSVTYEIPGDHFGIFREPNVKVLAAHLRACLAAKRQLEGSALEVVAESVRTSR